MTDRELLTYAAKAAGIKHPGGEHCINGPAVWDCDALRWWRPLTDDGDALRLVAQLDLNIEWFPRQRYLTADRLGIGENIGWIDESGRGGALRRAITVAAAKIGKALP